MDELLSRLQKTHARVYSSIMSVSTTSTVKPTKAKKKEKKKVEKKVKKTRKKKEVETKREVVQEEQSNETTALMEMDEALDVMKTFEIAETVLNPLKEKKWKEKKESLNVLTTFVSEKPKEFWKENKSCLVAIFSACVRATKEFKDSNFNIIRAAFELIGTMSKCCGSQLNRSLADRVMAPCTNKLGDRKTGPQALTLVLSLAEFSCGPRFVCLKMIAASAKIRSPLTLIGICDVLSQMVRGVRARSARILLSDLSSIMSLKSQ